MHPLRVNREDGNCETGTPNPLHQTLDDGRPGRKEVPVAPRKHRVRLNSSRGIDHDHSSGPQLGDHLFHRACSGREGLIYYNAVFENAAHIPGQLSLLCNNVEVISAGETHEGGEVSKSRMISDEERRSVAW